MDRDPAAASAEYMAQFRTDVEAFITRESVEACVEKAVFERPPIRAQRYVAFVDPSGRSADAMTLAIAHKEGETEILDAVRERRPPFSPEAVVEEYAALIRKLRDCVWRPIRWKWPCEQFQKRGIYYEPAEQTKAQLSTFCPSSIQGQSTFSTMIASCSSSSR